ncbi:unnamed protein product [Penicillium camemberti]|uniref:Str. FM013 n=1 Tax=Penicillium camemberti (strain FM 013) TaxID=1429867 RepID=A0A0G4NYL9_PENC3|nr:unnamed protein product [Penicillium camemberti]
MHGHLPEFTRALNTRAIMNIPAEQTLRDLLERYPRNDLLQYQVGRACAAGGYTSLYLGLDLLPDVAIAEEPRDNRTSEQAIYESIINSPMRWACMND